ncbi:MAG TPA: hypothetical protein VMH82_00550 [Myxococcota bacterium]|nr:hypothetical protein [Myxococcota bacterium]
MSNRRLVAVLGGLALLAAATPVRAGFPGSNTAGEVQRSSLRYVCANATATQCPIDPQSGDFTPATSCPAANPTPLCVADFIPNAEIRALLTIVADDRTPAATDFGDVRAFAMLEFKIGEDSYAIADAFNPQSAVGEWFNVPTERDIYKFDFAGGALMEGSLASLRQEILKIGRARLGIPSTGVMPVMLEGLVATPNTAGSATPEGTPKPQELETNQSCVPSDTDPSCTGVPAGQPLASIARYRVSIQFARCLDASAPSCLD